MSQQRIGSDAGGRGVGKYLGKWRMMCGQKHSGFGGSLIVRIEGWHSTEVKVRQSVH